MISAKKKIQLGTMGQTALDSHAKSEKHKRYIADQSGSLPIQMFTMPSSRRCSRTPSVRARLVVAETRRHILRDLALLHM